MLYQLSCTYLSEVDGGLWEVVGGGGGSGGGGGPSSNGGTSTINTRQQRNWRDPCRRTRARPRVTCAGDLAGQFVFKNVFTWVCGGSRNTRLLSHAAAGTFLGDIIILLLLLLILLLLFLLICVVPSRRSLLRLRVIFDDTHSRIIPFNLVQSVFMATQKHTRIQGRFTFAHSLYIIKFIIIYSTVIIYYTKYHIPT